MQSSGRFGDRALVPDHIEKKKAARETQWCQCGGKREREREMQPAQDVASPSTRDETRWDEPPSRVMPPKNEEGKLEGSGCQGNGLWWGKETPILFFKTPFWGKLRCVCYFFVKIRWVKKRSFETWHKCEAFWISTFGQTDLALFFLSKIVWIGLFLRVRFNRAEMEGGGGKVSDRKRRSHSRPIYPFSGFFWRGGGRQRKRRSLFFLPRTDGNEFSSFLRKKREWVWAKVTGSATFVASPSLKAIMFSCISSFMGSKWLPPKRNHFLLYAQKTSLPNQQVRYAKRELSIGIPCIGLCPSSTPNFMILIQKAGGWHTFRSLVRKCVVGWVLFPHRHWRKQ